ncbi:hypothetical protein WJX84_006516 [Apatococcus fuscideae]|uniref:Homoserine dehydrogenase n=1 Tax=Apatococcus fuscideae TaxID=2026836 RepID=A0AAW1TE40_9CHLO
MPSVRVGVIGVTGGVGRTLVKQLQAQAPWLASRGVNFEISSVANSKKMAFQVPSTDRLDWSSLLQQGEPLDTQSFLDSMKPRDSDQHCLVFDCSASEAVAQLYLGALHSGIHVITPNKRLTSAPLEYCKAVQQAQWHCPNGSPRPHGQAKRVLYEAAVGAGLPIITTLQDLLSSGDEVQSIQGILSGTLSHLFNSYGPGQSFARLVQDARAQGYTEPDPRDDLCGMDVARKVLTLARECGVAMELGDVQVESLIPADMPAEMSSEEFLTSFSQYDSVMQHRLEQAAAANRVLRYVGCVDIPNRTCSVALQEFPQDHPFAQLSGTDNIVSFHTRRYSPQPLTIRGPGAGLEVTAAGVFGDFLRLLRSLGYAV